MGMAIDWIDIDYSNYLLQIDEIIKILTAIIKTAQTNQNTKL